MHDERKRFVPSQDKEETEVDEAFRMASFHIRYDIKNLRDYVLQTPSMPNQEQVLRALEEILAFVPPPSEHDEKVWEYMRRTDNGEVVDHPEDPGDPSPQELQDYWQEVKDWRKTAE